MGERLRNIGLLILRWGLGAMFLIHGFPKLTGGPAVWTNLGSAMGNFGLNWIPSFWGLMAGVAEFGGGLCLITGLFFRPACLVMAFTMAVAVLKHFGQGDGLLVASHAIEDGFVFVALALMGAGPYYLKINFKKKQN